MPKIGLFYGSTTGNTETIASQIQEQIGKDQVVLHNVDSANQSDLEQYDKLIFGTSTWGVGDLQDDFEEFIDKINNTDLSGKKTAIYGLGDSSGYPDSFVDGMGIIYESVTTAGGIVVGQTPTDDYNYDASRAEIDGLFIGLPLDTDSEDEKTESRLQSWIKQLKKDLL